MDLISDSFSRLKLKDQHFHVYKPYCLEEIDKLFGNISLDLELKPLQKPDYLSNRNYPNILHIMDEKEQTLFRLKSKVLLIVALAYCHN